MCRELFFGFQPFQLFFPFSRSRISVSNCSSLVSDIIMPPIGLLIGGVKFESLKIVLKHAHTDAVTGKVTEAVSINYGNFINTALDFGQQLFFFTWSRWRSGLSFFFSFHTVDQLDE